MTVARAIRLLLAFITGCIVVWSFFDVGKRAYQEQSRSEGGITLSLLHWGDKTEDVIVQDLIDDYERDHPNIHIIRINPTYDQFRTKLKTMISAGTPPDIFYLPPDLLPEMASRKLIPSFDDYVARERASGKGQYLDDFWPLLMKAWHYDVKSGQIGAGHLYGLPKDFTTAVMYVNLDLFEKAGVKVPYDGWTWDEFEADMKKIRALSGTPAVEGRTIYGGMLEVWVDSLRNIIWTYGGDYFGTNPDGTPNFRDVRLSDPPAQEAMKMIHRVRFIDRTCFNDTGGGAQNNDLGFAEFVAGNIGCDGPVGRWKTPRLMGELPFRWDVVPVPYKDKKDQASMTYYTAWTMSSGTKHPDECFKLIRFLCGPKGASLQSRAGLAIPPLMSVARSDDFLNPPGMPPHRAQTFLDAINYARIQQIPLDHWLWARTVEEQTQRCLQLNQASTQAVAQATKQNWLKILDSPLRQREWPPMKWNWIIFVTIAAVLAITTVLWFKARREKMGPLDRAQERAGFLFIAPWLIGFLALTAGPMIVSLLLSFTDWSALTPMSQANSVGLANYQQMFRSDDTFYQSLRVTFYFVALAVPITQIAALAVAMLMNLKIRGITIFRTIYFVPSVVSGVALAVLWRQIFNNEYGIFNAILSPITHLFGASPPDWFGVDAHRWAIPAFVIMGLWGVGGGMILYLAGLKGIPASLYEAATIDGASPLRRLWNVTLPMLSPLIFYNVVMGIIGSFQVFTQAVVMTNGGPNNATLFYVLNLYREAFEFHEMGYASAMAWVLFVIVLACTLLIFRGSRNLVYYEGLKT